MVISIGQQWGANYLLLWTVPVTPFVSVLVKVMRARLPTSGAIAFLSVSDTSSCFMPRRFPYCDIAR